MTNHVVFSGGIDSTVVLSRVLADHPGEGTTALSYRYGQRHSRELEQAGRIAARLGVVHRVVDVRGLLHGSALLDPTIPVPREPYDPATMSDTAVSGRNLLFASVAVAQAARGDTVWVGVHAGDHHIYPDCRPEFWDFLASAVAGAYGVTLEAPYLRLTKRDIVQQGRDLGAPLDLTWSCYEGGSTHCGKCGTCRERAEAFREAAVPDPTEYSEPGER